MGRQNEISAPEDERFVLVASKEEKRYRPYSSSLICFEKSSHKATFSSSNNWSQHYSPADLRARTEKREWMARVIFEFRERDES